MVRLLLTIFGVGLVVAFLCSVGVQMLGGFPSRHWPPWGHNSWTWNGDGNDDGELLGPVTTRDIAWTGGDKLQFDVPAVIHYTQGPVIKITATGPQNWVDKLRMDGDVLTVTGNIRLRSQGQGASPLTLTITAPSVRQFQMDGAQKIDINAYAQDNLDLQSNGAAQINASGAAKSLRLQLNGAGHANLGHLVNQDADVQLNGASQATLAATGSADIEINGVGSVTLLHRPQTLHSQKHGFGSINIREDGDDDWQGDENAKPAPAPASPPPAPPLPKLKGRPA